MARSSNDQDTETQAEEKPVETSSQPLGSTWELGSRKGQRVEITRPDESVVTVTRGLHVLDIPGDYSATVAGTEHRVTAK